MKFHFDYHFNPVGSIEAPTLWRNTTLVINNARKDMVFFCLE
jgi:hypothetical protein